jgi:hypothetical protein
MAVFVGATVIHRCRVNERRGIGITACGLRFTLGQLGYDPNGRYTDDYVDWLNDRIEAGETVPCKVGPGYRDRGLCFHCNDREPAWKRLKRERERRRRWLAYRQFYGHT